MRHLRHIRLRSRAPRSAVERAVTRFVILSCAALVILGVATILVSRHIAREEALRDARERSETIARSVAAPLVNSAVRNRDPDAMRELSTVLRNRIRYGSVIELTLWDAEGRVLWAHDPQLVGEQFDLPPYLRELALRQGAVVEQSRESESNPGRDEDADESLEIYVGAFDADGEPFLLGAELPPDRIDEDYRAVLGALVPLGLGLLVLLQLATLPLALSLARRIDRSNAQRSNILKRSLASWHEERRVLAQELHDGVIQDLAGMSYALPAVIDQLPEEASADAARATGRVMNDILVRSLTALRATILDLVPVEVDGPGVVSALESLRDHASTVGLDVTLTVDPDLDVGQGAGGLIYRVVREGLRNVEKHAEATTALVVIARRGELVEIVVSDNGRGPPAEPADRGHVGLRLLGQAVRDLGGTLALSSDPQSGASLRVVVPARLPDLDEEL